MVPPTATLDLATDKAGALTKFKPKAKDTGLIDLLRGWPSSSLLPTTQLRTAATSILSDPDQSTTALLYGPDQGHEPLRENIASWLTTFYQPPSNERAPEEAQVDPWKDHQPVCSSRITITGGASQSLGNILSVFTDPSYTTAIFIVVPAYYLAFRIFNDAGFSGERLVPIPEGKEGCDLAFLEKELKARENQGENGRNGKGQRSFKSSPDRPWAKVYKNVIYCVPTFGNPSGGTMTQRVREGVVRLARKFDALVVCDDVYDFLRWRLEDGGKREDGLDLPPLPPPPPRLIDVDRTLDDGALREGADGFGNVVSNGSFSKIGGPGLRVGWCEGSEKLAYGISQVGTTRSGGAPSQLTSVYISHFLATGQLERHIQVNLIPAYARRHAILQAAVEKHLIPLGFSIPRQGEPSALSTQVPASVTTPREAASKVAGGFFLWLSLPCSPFPRASTLARRCREEVGVIIAEGGLFEVPRPRAIEDDDGPKNRPVSIGEKSVEFDGFIRLCHAWEEEEKLDEGIRKIADVAGRTIDAMNSASNSMDGKDGGTGEYVIVESGDGVEMEEFK